jgi:hypothetical protein
MKNQKCLAIKATAGVHFHVLSPLTADQKVVLKIEKGDEALWVFSSVESFLFV